MCSQTEDNFIKWLPSQSDAERVKVDDDLSVVEGDRSTCRVVPHVAPRKVPCFSTGLLHRGRTFLFGRGSTASG